MAGQPVPDWEKNVAAPFRSFTSKNLRTMPLLLRLLPQNWFRSSTAVEALAGQYEKKITRLKLAELPQQPHYIFCSTDMSFGVNWTFERERVGDYQAGYMRKVPDWPVARAVAASSCFPPIFGPLPVGLQPNQLVGGKAARTANRDELIKGLRLTDGGVYDNMGLEPVWKTHKTILVSDGGATFGYEWDKGLIWRVNRYTSIVGSQARALRKRWLISGFMTSEMQGGYWGIGSVTAHYGSHAPTGYSQALVEQYVSQVRTDMDAFSEGEQAVLENHGYLLADATVQQHAPDLLGSNPPAASVPHPKWMSEEKVRAALKDSHKLKLPFGRY